MVDKAYPFLYGPLDLELGNVCGSGSGALFVSTQNSQYCCCCQNYIILYKSYAWPQPDQAANAAATYPPSPWQITHPKAATT
jgi:hypothetical protein